MTTREPGARLVLTQGLAFKPRAAAFFGGWVDHAIVWLYSTFSAIPYIVLLMVLAATRMACGEPVQSYEFSFLDALQSAQRVDARAGRLNLRNAGGNTVIRFISEARQPVAQ